MPPNASTVDTNMHFEQIVKKRKSVADMADKSASDTKFKVTKPAKQRKVRALRKSLKKPVDTEIQTMFMSHTRCSCQSQTQTHILASNVQTHILPCNVQTQTLSHASVEHVCW